MKKVLALAFGAAMSTGALAVPASLLPPGPVYLKYSGQEQIAINGATTYAGSKEINWGVFVMSTMEKGSVAKPNDSIDPNGDFFYGNGFSGGQVTGMFYGIERGEASATNPFPATKGFMDLYWRDTDIYKKSTINIKDDGVRCGWNCAKGFTEGTFLARLYFDTGMDLGSKTNTIVGTTVPVSGNFSGFADSYASIDKSAGGLWANQLDSNYFHTLLGNRDLRFKNSYHYNQNWNGGTNIVGARVDDPGQAYVLPEPGALSLMGLAMFGMGVTLRRRRKN
ncbi:PEP-CTERM sorting domain-containing protein [Massilia niastensis]|uniref:PEP-CTERM sorting domain-containing protein n=1 Tax=Massilia niastensis TaxID=544911 RepID=UPI00037FDD20|nr:PEP-CTERM sorting domain-containing protein [Massilia niastensis]